MNAANFVIEEASEDDAEVEDEYEAEDEILREEEIAARKLVEERHRRIDEENKRSAQEIADRFVRQAQRDKIIEQNQTAYYGTSGLGEGQKNNAIIQQSLLPTYQDPGIWRVKCRTGHETQLVMQIMFKALASKAAGGPLRIKSCFSNGSKGFIYIETIADVLAREAIQGLRGVNQSSLTKVSLNEMVPVLTITKTKVPIRLNQFARLSRGPMKGDLVRIVDVYDGGMKVMIQV